MENYDRVEVIEPNEFWGGSPGRTSYYLGIYLHRLDGPAEIWSDGDEGWFQNGLPHRVDGPAVTGSDGDEYYYHGRLYDNTETWFEAMSPEDKSKALWHLDIEIKEKE